jgi:1-acyl-sn-glycerol-3-phosphate acyltransferase
VEFPYRAPTVPTTVEPRPPRRRTGIDYDTRWARDLPARWGRAVLLGAVLRPAVAAVARPRRCGLDHLADLDGPIVFASNHHSHIDAGLLLTSLPEPWRHKVFTGAAADYFFTNRVTSAASALALNAIPIERTRVNRRSADQAAELIDDGWSMVIFPEGGRSPDGWGQPFRGGAAYLAIRCRVPVVPIHVSGTGRILPKGAKRLRPGRTVVTFGRPLWAEEGEDSRRFAARLEREVAALADESGSDWYSARRRAHAGQSPSLTGPEVATWRRAWALGDRRPDRRRRPTGRWPEV